MVSFGRLSILGSFSYFIYELKEDYYFSGEKQLLKLQEAIAIQVEL